MARLCFDYGHGGEDSGAYYNGRRECDDVLNIGRQVAAEVRRHGVTVDETRTSDATVSLQDRSNFERRNSYDYFISFHRNAYEPEVAKGVETYVCLNAGAKSRGLAEKMQNAMVNLGFVDRGVKEANFHLLRETYASAVLVEMGFIDKSSDNALFDSNKDSIVKALAAAILAQIGISYVEPVVAPPPTINATEVQVLYRVMAGSYSIRENAENQVQRLKDAGFEACIMIYNR